MIKISPTNKSRAQHQARDDAFGPKRGGKRPGAGRSPFSTADRMKGAKLTAKVLQRGRKK